MFGLQGWHLLIVIAVIVLLFGATRLPTLARSLGQSMKIFRSEIKGDEKEAEAGTAESTAAPSSTSSGTSESSGSSDAPAKG